MTARALCTAMRLMVMSALAGACGTFSPNAATSPDGPGSPALLQTGVTEQPRNLPKSRYGNPPTYSVFGKRYAVMSSAAGYREVGIASWYGAKFHGRKTSSGEVYNMYNLTAAHRSLPLPTFVRVTNLDNGATLVVKVNDRGPFHADRVIDLSYAAAARLGVLAKGTANVEVEAISVHTDAQDESAVTLAMSAPPASVAAAEADSVVTGELPVTSARQRGITIIQVGAFGTWENADLVRQRVDDAIEVQAAYIIEDPNRPLHKVRFKIVDNAPLEQILRQLEDAGIRQFTVVGQ